jgi:nucleoside-diphosphate-sugar epimerase
MLKACVDYGIKRFVYSSSSSVYGDVETTPTPESHKLNPMSPYALQKLIGEQYCKLYSELHGLETACLRYFNVYGDNMSLEGAYKLVIPIFVGQRMNGEPMTIRGDGEQRRDFTYVGDVVDANIKCMDYPLELNGDVFNIGNGDNRSVNDIANMIDGDRINVDPVIEPKETLADNSKAKRVLEWKPTMKIEDWVINYKEKMGL